MRPKVKSGVYLVCFFDFRRTWGWVSADNLVRAGDKAVDAAIVCEDVAVGVDACVWMCVGVWVGGCRVVYAAQGQEWSMSRVLL